MRPRLICLGGLALGLAASASVAGCASLTPDVSADTATYRTVAELNEAADAVVVGTIGPIVVKELDNGGDPEVGDDGQPMGLTVAFHDVAVDSVLRGHAGTGRLVVASVNTQKLSRGYPTSELTEGQRVVLWLDHLTSEDAPGIASVREFWVPVSGGNGVMDIEGDRAVARTATLSGIDRAGSSALNVDLLALVHAVEPR